MSDKDRWVYFFGFANANFYYNKFLELCKHPNNRELERSTVMKEIQNLLNSESSLQLSLEVGEMVYRARKFNIDNLKAVTDRQYVWKEGFNFQFQGYDKYDSIEPPLGIANHERNSYKGASYLYVAEDKYTACSELRPIFGDLISVATFQVNRSLRLVNFSDDITILSSDKQYNLARLITLVMTQFTHPVTSTDASEIEMSYFPSQYISDYIRKRGFDGICYRSFWGGGRCYTIFNGSHDFEHIKSELVASRVQEYQLYELNNGVRITPTDEYRNRTGFTEKTFKEIQKKYANKISKVLNHEPPET